ncbi:MAG: cytochrome c oxidase assembly protein [Paucibacter sp.]|nr:cytochrome c oxidase assembly protein [Roseateles sp.]
MVDQALDPHEPEASAPRAASNRRLVGKLVVIAALMFGFGYIVLPWGYRLACEAIGLNVVALSEQDGDRGAALARNTQVDMSRSVEVEFDTNVKGPWSFHPEVAHLRVHPGELTTVVYEFRNVQPRTMTAQAVPSYAPVQATSHFVKLECFCFNEYTLAPGEAKRWPVVFYVDDKLPRDVKTITLSYTFFEIAGKQIDARKLVVSKAAEGRT